MSDYKEISLLGDSIGQGYWDQSGIGWFGRLAQKLGESHPYQFGFHNASQSGDTVIDALHRLSTEVAQRGADYLLIAVGINDLVRWHSPEGQTSLSPNTSRTTWTLLLEQAGRIAAKCMVVGCLPVIETRFPQSGVLDTPLYHLNDDILRYNAMVAELCRTGNVHHADIFPTFFGRDELFRDASHPNTHGHQLIADLIYERICEAGWCVT